MTREIYEKEISKPEDGQTGEQSQAAAELYFYSLPCRAHLSVLKSGLFQNALSLNRRNLKTRDFRLRVVGKHFTKGDFRKPVVTIIIRVPLPSLPQSQIQNDQ